jgi:putative ABC transport system permease protein
MSFLRQDLPHAWRGLARNPVFTLTAVLTLALGIGANTAIFSVLDTLLLRKLPVPQPDQLVLPRAAGTLQSLNAWEWEAYEAFRDHNQVFSGVLAFSRASVSEMVRAGRASRAQVEFVSPNYFMMLGVRPLVGLLSSQQGTPVVFLGFDYWKREFQSSPAAIGKSVRLGDRSYTIAGVAPPGFFGAAVGSVPDVYVPFDSASRSADWVNILGRLKPGVTLAQAQQRLEPLFQEIVRQSSVPAVEKRQAMARLVLEPAANGVSGIREQYSLPVRIAMLFVGFVLLIGCCNVANLLLARGIARERESAIRLALGAGRWRLIRQFVTESALLSIIGTAAGFLAGRWTYALLVAFLSTGRKPILLNSGLTNHVVLFIAAVSAFSLLCCGLLPALSATRLTSGQHIHLGRPSPLSSRSPLGKFLVVAQVALSTTALICSSLLMHSLIRLETFDVGFDRDHVLAVSLGGHRAGETPAEVAHFFQALSDGVKALPEVRNASLSMLSPVAGREIGINVAVEGYQTAPGEETHVFISQVTPGYFQTLGIPLLWGRDFDAHDTPTSPRVAVINRAMAHHFFGGANPVGKRFTFVEGLHVPMEIIGVVADSTYNDLRETTPDFVYLGQQTARPIAGVLHVRFIGSGSRPLAVKVTSLIASLDSSVSIAGIRTLREQIDESLHEDRLTSVVGASFSLLALVLTCVGLYGLLSFSVARRSGEIGIRMALGAQRGAVVRLVLREVIALVMAGIAVGLPMSMAASRSISGMLFGLSAGDPFAVVLSIAVLVAVALVAGYLPARRAAHIDPMAALRFE